MSYANFKMWWDPKTLPKPLQNLIFLKLLVTMLKEISCDPVFFRPPLLSFLSNAQHANGADGDDIDANGDDQNR